MLCKVRSSCNVKSKFCQISSLVAAKCYEVAIESMMQTQVPRCTVLYCCHETETWHGVSWCVLV